MRVRERSREEEGSVWERRIKRGPPGRGVGGGCNHRTLYSSLTLPNILKWIIMGRVCMRSKNAVCMPGDVRMKPVILGNHRR